MIKEIEKYATEYKMYPLSAEMYSDVTTPINLLKKLSEISTDYYLLESVENANTIGRYTFLGYNPMLSIEYKGDFTTITENDEATLTTEDPIKILRRYIKNYKSPKIKGLPPFTGGFVGYMAYEMIGYAEPKLKLPTNNFNDFELKLFDKVIAFDNLRKKITIIVNIQLDNIEERYEQAKQEIEKIATLIKTSDTTSGQTFSSNFNTKYNDIYNERINERLSERINGILHKGITEKNHTAQRRAKVTFTSNLSQEQYTQMVTKAQKYIKHGDIFQVVLSKRFEASYAGSLIDAYRVLRVNNPSPYMYFIKYGTTEICGASPETLVKVIDNKVTTFPVAGSRPRGKDTPEDKQLEEELLNDEKELAEHNMLVDLARNDVGKVSKIGTVEVEEYLQIHRYSRIMHIASIVSGQLKETNDAFDAITSLLPAGTLSGAPKFRACEIIAELEGQSRGIYGGAIGYIDLSGNLDMCIAIRTAVYDGHKVYVQAGAGIVYDSIPEREFAECTTKASAIISAVENANTVDQLIF